MPPPKKALSPASRAKADKRNEREKTKRAADAAASGGAKSGFKLNYISKSPAPQSDVYLSVRGMVYPMANMDIRANSVKHLLECRFACCKSTTDRGFIGSKIIPRAFSARRSTYFDA
jgi:hypothetical protein